MSKIYSVDTSASQSFIVKKLHRYSREISRILKHLKDIIFGKTNYTAMYFRILFYDKSVSQDIPYSQQNSVNPKSNNVLKFNTLSDWLRQLSTLVFDIHCPHRNTHHRWWNIGTLVAPNINSDTHVHIETPTS